MNEGVTVLEAEVLTSSLVTRESRELSLYMNEDMVTVPEAGVLASSLVRENLANSRCTWTRVQWRYRKRKYLRLVWWRENLANSRCTWTRVRWWYPKRKSLPAASTETPTTDLEKTPKIKRKSHWFPRTVKLISTRSNCLFNNVSFTAPSLGDHLLLQPQVWWHGVNDLSHSSERRYWLYKRGFRIDSLTQMLVAQVPDQLTRAQKWTPANDVLLTSPPSHWFSGPSAPHRLVGTDGREGDILPRATRLYREGRLEVRVSRSSNHCSSLQDPETKHTEYRLEVRVPGPPTTAAASKNPETRNTEYRLEVRVSRSPNHCSSLRNPETKHTRVHLGG